MRRKILAIAAAVMLGTATMSTGALAHGGGGGGGHGGGGFGGHFGGGFGGHSMGMGGARGFTTGRGFSAHGFAMGHGAFRHGRFDHDFRGRRFARGFGFGLSDYGYCNWPYSYDYNSCYGYGW